MASSSPSSSHKRNVSQCNSEKKKVSDPTSDALCSEEASFILETKIRGARFHDSKKLRIGDKLFCVREKDNQVDTNAIALFAVDDANQYQVGYLARDLVSEMAAAFDEGVIALTATVQSRARSDQVAIQVVVSGSGAEEIYSRVDHREKRSFTDRVYCENMDVLVETVERQNRHMLYPEESKTYHQLCDLDQNSKALLLRLIYARKRECFRVRELDYFSPSLIESSVCNLLKIKFLAPASRKRMISIMTNVEMKRFLKKQRKRDPMIQISGNKKTMTQEVERILEAKPLMIKDICGMIGETVEIDDQLIKDLRLAEQLYFLDENGTRNLSDFILLELNRIRWPSFKVNVQRSVFPNRQCFDAYCSSIQHLRIFEIWIKNNAHDQIRNFLETIWQHLESGDHKNIDWSGDRAKSKVPNPVTTSSDVMEIPLFLARYRAIWVQVKMADMGVEYLEQRKQYKTAIQKLRILLDGNCCLSLRGKWWNRLVVDLLHVRKQDAAYKTCESALEDEWVRHGELYSIRKQYLRLRKKRILWKQPKWAFQLRQEHKIVEIPGSPLQCIQSQKSEFLTKDGEIVSVEGLALKHYAEHGDWSGMHTEGSLWTTLFGIIFWNEIFADIEDMFRSPFQDAPLDFGSDAFYHRCHDLIENRLQQIQHGNIRDSIETVWSLQHGVRCRGVQWETFYNLDQLLAIMDCIGSSKLAAICRLFAEDYGSVRAGMPDLFLWNVNRKECKLSEVKGPKDTLSDKQQSWIRILLGTGLDVEVCKVISK